MLWPGPVSFDDSSFECPRRDIVLLFSRIAFGRAPRRWVPVVRYVKRQNGASTFRRLLNPRTKDCAPESPQCV